MDKSDDADFADLVPGRSSDEVPNWRKRVVRGAWLLGAWIAFLTILALLDLRYPTEFDHFISDCGKGRYRKLGMGVLLAGALMIIFPPFISAINLLIGGFEAATGMPFRRIESWFDALSWSKKCLVAPAMAAPLAVLACGLIWFGAIVVKKFVASGAP